MAKIIRTSTLARGGITKEEEKQLKAHADLWIRRALRTEPVDPAKLIPAIEGIYQAAGLKKPRVVIVPSPLVMAFAYGASAAVWYNRRTISRDAQVATDAATEAATHDATHGAAYAATYGATYDATHDTTRDATRAATLDATNATTRGAPYAATYNATLDATNAAALMNKATFSAAYRATVAAMDRATHTTTFAATDISGVIDTTVRAATRAATRDAIYHAAYAATRDATYAATDNATHEPASALIFKEADDVTFVATDNATRAATRAATDAATYDATIAATIAATYGATYAATRDATNDATRTNTMDVSTMGAAHACYQMAGQFGVECAARWVSIYQGGNMWAPFECYLSGARDILGLQLPSHENYKFWETAAIEGGFRVIHEEFCIVSDFPLFIKKDALHRPHCETGPSHLWRDGWALYHWHGVRVPESWITDRTNLSAAEVMRTTNLEVRRAGIEILGWDKILRELKAVTIDQDADPEIGALVQVFLPDLVGPSRFLRVRCGTGREFTIGVPSNMTSALEAQAWVVGLNPGDHYLRPEVRT